MSSNSSSSSRIWRNPQYCLVILMGVIYVRCVWNDVLLLKTVIFTITKIICGKVLLEDSHHARCVWKILLIQRERMLEKLLYTNANEY